MKEERIQNAFSTEGMLFQVEYALEGAKKGMGCVIIIGKSSIVMAASKRIPEKLIDPTNVSSFFEILPSTVGVVSGYPMDVQETAFQTKKVGVQFLHTLGKEPTPDILARALADKWQLRTQESSRRLTAANLAVVGYDGEEPLLYHTDSSGSLLPYRAIAFGEGGTVMMKKLEKIFRPQEADERVLQMALIALSESLGSDYLATNVELAVLRKGVPLLRKTTDEIDALLVQIAEESV
ncbi:2S proteasome subunit alpha 1 [Nematocida displodere]|uniref:2S proteasome subunit alpha 1 n=1 Tax=Nematocida displodere TaxID=1805483 RepID=A0A177EC45_9MICR|nr:2S proteasome subunit alpha 1 [Nematocida displodere]